MYDGILVIVTMTFPESFQIIIRHRSNFIKSFLLVCFVILLLLLYPFNYFLKIIFCVYLYLVLNLFNESDFR
jgi:hypothetical protein